MKKILLLCVLATSTLSLNLAFSTNSYAMAPGCGCGGSGATCQTNQRVVFATLALVGGFYHYQILNPIAKSTQLPLIVYSVGYTVPAAAIYAAYQWWNQESPKVSKNQE